MNNHDRIDINRDIAIRAQKERDEALEIVQVQAETIQALEALLAISRLHQPDGPACTCGTTWPCPTARALGEDG